MLLNGVGDFFTNARGNFKWWPQRFINTTTFRLNKSTIQNQTNPFTLSPNQIPLSSYNNLSSHMIRLTLAEYNIHEQF